MPSVLFFKFRFTPSWKMLLITALFFALFLWLGLWQIHRSEEKLQMINAQKKRENLPVIYWDVKKKLPLQYQRIGLQGIYLPQTFLLDNQHHRHQFGYHVLTPFVLADDAVVMIDRGWIPGDVTRRVFPDIQIPSGFMKLEGTVYFPSINRWIFGPESEEKANKTVILERINQQLLSQILQKEVYPFIIRLDKQDTHGFVREWETVSMPPQRHLAYALQWFAMAFAVLIIFIALNLKKKDEEKKY